jgi:hypothetical protein
VRYLNITVRYSVQIGEAKSICGAHVQSRTLELKARIHYVKTSYRSHSICNGPLMPVTSTHICNGCCLAPVTNKRAKTTSGLASTTPVTNVDFW